MKFYIGSGLKNYELVNYYSKVLTSHGWQRTYDWTKYIQNEITFQALEQYAKAERQGIREADVVIILLPAGRGTHVELGMALGMNKRIYICTGAEEEFNLENMVDFYELPDIVRVVGTADENIEAILKDA